jgi:ribosomal protein L37AE/L43A
VNPAHWIVIIVVCIAGVWVGQNIRRQIQQRGCVHHGRNTGETWLKSELVDSGARKIWTCTGCGQTWST